jgi:sulfur carrier protein
MRSRKSRVSPTLNIRLNGDTVELPGPMTVRELLAHLGIDPRRVAVEHNLAVVKRPAYEKTVVADGDEVEVVNFVGGGSPGSPCDSLRSLRAGGASSTEYRT